MVFTLALAAVSAATVCAFAVSATDVDGRSIALNPAGKVSVVLYLNGDLDEEARKISQGLDSYTGRGDFQVARVVDLRGEVPPVARQTVTKETLKQLDKEAARLKPVYARNGWGGNPRSDLNTVLDFHGGTLRALGWTQTYNSVQVIVFNKKGVEVKRFAASSAAPIITAIKAAY
ncbi:hypothetical protein DB346_11315 [Verrucomicrobia bacterium LW23]|nr:hypothetical protein DB346_11315 [Verrucomicrobia bacterium LW23]